MTYRGAHALVAGCVVTLALAGAGCGGGSEKSAQETTPPPTTTESTTPSTSPQETQPKPKRPGVTTVRIVVRGGKVVGGLRQVRVNKGKKVALVVVSDVADEVHLHGYDRMVDVAPGMRARVVFVASIPGRFEVELEDRGLQIADLEVRP